jgi:hypothetical protein
VENEVYLGESIWASEGEIERVVNFDGRVLCVEEDERM